MLYSYEAQNKEEAINKALNDLNTTRENLLIQSIEEIKGIVKKKVTIKVLKFDEVVKFIKDTLYDIAKYIGIDINLEVRKREDQITIKMFSDNNNILIGKGGTAVITTLSVLAILTSVTGSKIDINTTIIVALVSAIASFASSLAPGFEVMFTSILVFKLTNVSLYGAEMTIMGLLPFVNGLAVMLDAQIAMLGNVVAARFIKNCLLLLLSFIY